MKNNITILVSDIRFWILFFFALQLFHCTLPPIEIGHAWRQCYTLSVARYYYEHGVDWLYPRVTHRGASGGGVAGCEFPLLNAIIAYLAHIWGYNHWFARVVNMAISSTGIYYFYRVLREFVEPIFEPILEVENKEKTPYYNTNLAFFATISMLSSIWFAYSRKTMPDTFSIALVLIGLYYGLQYAYRQKITHLLLYGFLAALGVLSKLPALMLLAPLLVPLLDARVALRPKVFLLATSAAAFGLAFAWYFYWVPYLVATYQNPLFFPTALGQGLSQISQNAHLTLERFYATALFSYIGNALLLFGLWDLWQRKNSAIGVSLASIFAIFIFYMLKTGEVFSHHVYYIVPLVPAMAFLVGVGARRLHQYKPIFAFAVVAIMAIEGIANQLGDFYADKNSVSLLSLEALADKYTPNKNEVVMVTSSMSLCPTQAYFLHRTALTIDNNTLNNNEIRNLATANKINTLYVDKHNGTNRLDFRILYEDDYTIIYSVNTGVNTGVK